MLVDRRYPGGTGTPTEEPQPQGFLIMVHAEVKLSREELYRQVWDQPVSVVAKTYGMSDVSLAKLCRRLAIPLPGLGYWAKKRHGKRVHQPPLPAAPPDTDIEVKISPYHSAPADKAQVEEAAPLLDAEYLDQNEVHVAEVLQEPHPLVKAAQKLLRKSKPDDRGLLQPPPEPCLQILVSKAQLERALRIMDALVKACDARGFKVAIGESAGVPATLHLLGEALPVSLEEDLDKAVRPLSAAEKKEQGSYPWLRKKPEYDYSPSGRLVLQLHASTRAGTRRRWSDLDRRPLEKSLNAFLIGAMKLAVAVRAQRLEHERWQREWREAERLREEERLRKELDRARTERLERQLAAWQKCRQIRAYIRAVRRGAVQRHGQIQPGSELDQWLSWASDLADRLDPLLPSPPSGPDARDP